MNIEHRLFLPIVFFLYWPNYYATSDDLEEVNIKMLHILIRKNNSIYSEIIHESKRALSRNENIRKICLKLWIYVPVHNETQVTMFWK